MRPLVHIGYHKTGTTWLQRGFFPNKEAGLSFVAGPLRMIPAFIKVNDFDFDPAIARKRFSRSMEEAEAEGLVPVFSHERLSGSPYAGGHDSKAHADKLAATFPDARVLVVIREQTGIILSVYKQYLRQGGAASLEQFVTPPTGTGRVPVFQFAFYEYHRLIGYYKTLFGDESVLALPYELLKADPDGFLARITGFLDLPTSLPASRPRNISPSALSLSLKRQANRLFVRDGLNPAPFLERPGSNKPLHRAARRIDELAPKTLIERYEARRRSQAEELVGDRYAKSNAKTSDLIGIDLRAHGYA